MLHFRWFCLKSMDNCLSSGASELLHSISTNIVLLQKSLSNTLFDTILHEIADQMNRILFEDLILKNTFNELGAKQLHYDLSIGFMSLFRLYMARPQLHFAEYFALIYNIFYFVSKQIPIYSYGCDCCRPHSLPPLPLVVGIIFHKILPTLHWFIRRPKNSKSSDYCLWVSLTFIQSLFRKTYKLFLFKSFVFR